jgi:hypothetical protein
MVDRVAIRGLRVESALGDIRDPIEALENINLNINDLDRIRGISQIPDAVRRVDLITLSGLTRDVEKTLIAIEQETRSYDNILKNTNDGNQRLLGNIIVDGRVIAKSFKYRQYDPSDNTVKILDLSTSKASAWSSSGDPSVSIFYGGEVKVGGTIDVKDLNILAPAQTKRFASQIPTHLIEIEYNGETYEMYAMKGIPIIFNAFFRSGKEFLVDFTQPISGTTIRPSIIIRDLETNDETVYTNQGGTATRSRIARVDYAELKARDVEIYFPVDFIARIDLNAIGISKFPFVSLNSLTTLNLIDNDISEMPRFNDITPSLISLNLTGNNLSRSPTLNRFGDDVIARLPSTLQTLIISNTYSNEISQTQGLALLPNLRTFTCTSSSGQRALSGNESIAIGNSLLTYEIQQNNFNALHPSVLNSPNLQVLRIRQNSIGGNLVFGNAPGAGSSLRIYNTGNQSHGILNVNNKQNLETYIHTNSTIASGNDNQLVFGVQDTSIFNECRNLTSIDLRGLRNLRGPLPTFATNDRISLIDLFNTDLSGASVSHCVSDETFGSFSGTIAPCRASIRNFRLGSRVLTGTISDNAFRSMPNILEMVITSYRTSPGVTGTLFDSEGVSKFNQCVNLRNLVLNENQMSGNIPSFSSNNQLRLINLSSNKIGSNPGFDGAIPNISLPLLQTLNLSNNSLTSAGSTPVIINCPNIITINLSFNSISAIPNISTCLAIREVFFQNNPFNSYTTGIFANLTSLTRLNLTNCNMSQSIVHAILFDLYENYLKINRGNVVIELSGNASPNLAIVGDIIQDLRNVGWTIGV